MITVIQGLPADASVGDATERRSRLRQSARGLAQADAGQTVPQDVARVRRRAWRG